MTEKNQPNSRSGIPSGLSSFHLEASRSSRGMSLMLSGIIGISDFSEERIELLSHGGRVIISGKRLFINVYENNNLEILGKAEEIIFRYGKN